MQWPPSKLPRRPPHRTLLIGDDFGPLKLDTTRKKSSVPCIFCIAVFAILTTAVSTAVLDQLESRLATEAATPVRRTTNSSSVSRFEFEFPVPPINAGRHRPNKTVMAPVALTVYKRYGRVRIQVLTHDLHRAQAEALQKRIAAIAGLQIVEWSDPRTRNVVREAIEAESKMQAADSDSIQQRRWPQG